MNQPQNNHPCPYKGLQPFTTEDRDYFFGREDEIEIATSNLRVAPLTVLYGASGVGKTSVLMAGVVSRLQSEKEAAAIFFRDWQNAEFVSALRKETLDAIRKVTGNEIEIPEKDSFVDFLTECTKAFPGPLLFILDQFEEYFLYHGPTNNQTEAGQSKLDFDVELARAINRRDLRANFLLSLREDGLSKLDRLQTRIPNLLGNLVRLDHLNADSARAAIKKPLVVYNKISGEAPVKIEKELVEKLLSQVQTGHVMLSDSAAGDAQSPRDTGRIETSFLQLVLERLWLTEAARWQTEPKAEAHWLRAKTLDDLKGAAHIVRTHLDDVMASLEDIAREQQVSLSAQEAFPLIAEIFRFLVTSSGTKIAHTSDDLASFAELEDSKRNLLNDVLNLLALPRVRILRKVDPPPGSTGERFEIYHDVLGPAIRDWRIRFATEQAEAHAKAEADKILKQQRDEAEQKALAERREQERILAKQRDEAEQKAMAAQLAQATALADAERKRAAAERQRAELELTRGKEQAKAARRFRLAAVALAVLLLFAVGTSVFAFFQRNLATQKASEADKARKDAEAKANEARLARADAEAKANEARLARADAEAQAKDARLAKEDAIAKAEEARVAKDEAEKQRARAEIEKGKADTARAEADAARENENAYRRALDLSRREATKSQALTDLDRVLANFRKSRNTLATKDVILSIGDLNAELDKEKEAQEKYNEALLLAADKVEQAWMRTHIGDTYRELPAWWSSEPRKKALEQYQLALKLYKDAGSKVGEAATLTLMGHVSVDLALAQPSPSPVFNPNASTEPPPNQNLEEAVKHFDQAVKIYQDLRDEQGEATVLWNAGFALQKLPTREGRETARKYYTEAIQKYEKLGDRQSQVSILRNLTGISYQPEDIDKRVDYLIKSLRLYRELKDTAGEDNTVQQLGWAFGSTEIAGNRDALQRSQEVLDILRSSAASLEARRDPKAVNVKLSIARMHEVLKDLSSAMREYDEAFELAEQAKDVESQILILYLLVRMSPSTGDTVRTQRYLTKFRSLISEMPKDERRLYSLYSLASSALEAKQTEIAKNAYDEAIALARQLSNLTMVTEMLQNAARGFAGQGSMDTATFYFETLLRHFRELKQPGEEAEVFEELGFWHTQNKAYAKAIEYLEQALPLYHQANLVQKEAQVLRFISQNYRSLGNDSKADEYKRRADAVAPAPAPTPGPAPSVPCPSPSPG